MVEICLSVCVKMIQLMKVGRDVIAKSSQWHEHMLQHLCLRTEMRYTQVRYTSRRNTMAYLKALIKAWIYVLYGREYEVTYHFHFHIPMQPGCFPKEIVIFALLLLLSLKILSWLKQIFAPYCPPSTLSHLRVRNTNLFAMSIRYETGLGTLTKFLTKLRCLPYHQMIPHRMLVRQMCAFWI